MAQEKIKKIKIFQKRETCQYENIQFFRGLSQIYMEESEESPKKKDYFQIILVGLILTSFVSLIITLFLTNCEEFIGVICLIYEVLIAIVSLTLNLN